MYYLEAAIRNAMAPLDQQKQTSNILHCIDIKDGHEIWTVNPFLGDSIEGIPAAPQAGPQANLVVGPNVAATLVTRQVDPGGVGRPFLLFYDAWFGRIVRNVTLTDISTTAMGTRIIDRQPLGNYYMYFCDIVGNITKWDMFKHQTIANELGVPTFKDGIVWTTQAGGGRGVSMITGDRIVTARGDPDFPWLGFDTTTGKLLFNVTHHDYGVPYSNGAGYGKVHGICSDGYYRAWSADTGAEVWKTTYPDVYPWGIFQVYTTAAAFGNFYSGSYSGHYHCFDADTGAIVWDYFAGNSTETAMGHLAYWGAPAISGDGKIFISEGSQHPVASPMERGANIVCLNATTGEVIWKYSARDGGQDSGSKAIAEGKFFMTDHYTGYELCFDKGKTATTVTASPKITSEGDTVLIEGTVKDLSPAQPGTPCVSDASMTPWMEYLNINAAQPRNATGVQVTISVLDSNNNYRDIGTATTDPYHDGFFSFAWTPDIDGPYTVYANFEGTGSYWTSTAPAAFVVEPAQPAPETPTAVPVDNSLLYGILGAAIAAIVIGLIAILLILRKK
jgi:outer membrane protein assembly factor BamB